MSSVVVRGLDDLDVLIEELRRDPVRVRRCTTVKEEKNGGGRREFDFDPLRNESKMLVGEGASQMVSRIDSHEMVY